MMYTTPETAVASAETKIAIGQDEQGEKFISQDFTDFIISSAQDSRCLNPNPSDLISVPHSNSYVDLDGDCMPDIFLQKTRIHQVAVPGESSGVQTYYTSYYEIYVQKIYNDKAKYCLIQSEAQLVDQPADNKDPNKYVPLVDFTDVNRDGMVDMIFYYDSKVYVYYNNHPMVEFTSSLEQSLLCTKWNETSYQLIFYDHKNIKRLGKAETGNVNVTIQNL